MASLKSREIVKEIPDPVTQTHSQRKRVSDLSTRADTEEASVLSLSVQDNPPPITGKRLVVYIHPLKEEVEGLSDGSDKVSYIFRGIGAADLKERFLTATQRLPYLDYEELKQDVFRYDYPSERKRTVYDSAREANRIWNN